MVHRMLYVIKCTVWGNLLVYASYESIVWEVLAYILRNSRENLQQQNLDVLTLYNGRFVACHSSAEAEETLKLGNVVSFTCLRGEMKLFVGYFTSPNSYVYLLKVLLHLNVMQPCMLHARWTKLHRGLADFIPHAFGESWWNCSWEDVHSFAALPANSAIFPSVDSLFTLPVKWKSFWEEAIVAPLRTLNEEEDWEMNQLIFDTKLAAH